MIIADETRYLRLKLGGAITTAQLPIGGAYFREKIGAEENAARTSIHTVSNSTTEVTVVAVADSGYRHRLVNLSVHNADSAAATVTVEQYDGTNARIVSKAALAVGDTLHYEDGRGWYVLDDEGNLKTSTGAATGNALLDGTIHNDTATQGPTRGSLIYGNSTPKWDELTIGAATHYVGSDGTDVAWTLLPMVVVSEQTASSSATISFTGLSSTYRYYMVVLRDVLPATDSVSLYALMSTDGGSSYLSSAYRFHTADLTATGTTYAAINGNTAAQLTLTASSIGNASSEGVSGEIKFWNVTGSKKKVATWHFVIIDDGGVARAELGAGLNDTTSAVNAIRFQMESGNIASGTFTLYGIK